MTRSKEPKLANASSKSRKELIEEIETLTMRGLETAILLTKLGDVTSLADMIAVSQLAIMRGKNLLRAIDAAANETIS